MSPAILLPVLACILSGVLSAIQAPTNAMIARPLNSPVNAALVSFAVGTLALAVLAVFLRVRPDVDAAMKLPPYAWAGGLYGAFFVTVAAFAAPRIGVASVLTLMIAGQLVASLAVDHLGGFGLPRRPLNLERMMGVALVLAGVYLVRRS